MIESYFQNLCYGPANEGLEKIRIQEAKEFSRVARITLYAVGVLLALAATFFAANPLFSSNVRIIGGSVGGGLALITSYFARKAHKEHQVLEDMKLWQPIFEGILANDFAKVCNQIKDKILMPNIQKVMNPDPDVAKIPAKQRYPHLFNATKAFPFGTCIDRFQPNAWRAFDKQFGWGKDACSAQFAVIYGAALLYNPKIDRALAISQAKVITDLFVQNKGEELDVLIKIAEAGNLPPVAEKK